MRSKGCVYKIIAADYRARKRLDFQAEYDIRCSELEDRIAYSVFLVSARLSDEIEELCSGGTNSAKC